MIEVVFNVFYLLLLWSLVINMFKNTKFIKSYDIKLANNFKYAFLILVLGDTFHLGFRVFAYLNGGIFKYYKLIGFGSLLTAITLTLFYVYVLEIWRIRYNRGKNIVWILLYLTAVLRILIMFSPQNEWYTMIPNFKWTMYRNIPLIIQGLGIALAILYDSWVLKDKFFMWFSFLIFLSFGLYLPVLLYEHLLPEIGTFMILKTIVYIVMAFTAYFGFFNKRIT